MNLAPRYIFLRNFYILIRMWRKEDILMHCYLHPKVLKRRIFPPYKQKSEMLFFWYLLKFWIVFKNKASSHKTVKNIHVKKAFFSNYNTLYWKRKYCKYFFFWKLLILKQKCFQMINVFVFWCKCNFVIKRWPLKKLLKKNKFIESFLFFFLKMFQKKSELN